MELCGCGLSSAHHGQQPQRSPRLSREWRGRCPWCSQADSAEETSNTQPLYIRAERPPGSQFSQCLILQIRKEKPREGKEFPQDHTVSGIVGLEANLWMLAQMKLISLEGSWLLPTTQTN